MKIYKMKNCPHCEQVNYDLANKFNISVIDIHEGYDGFVPQQVPVLQGPGITLQGPQQINSILNLLENVTKAQK